MIEMMPSVAIPEESANEACLPAYVDPNDPCNVRMRIRVGRAQHFGIPLRVYMDNAVALERCVDASRQASQNIPSAGV